MDRQFPDWEQLYQEQAVESMPWFHEALDPDLERALHQLNVTQGTVLDIGTGPGTQAQALARLGFRVTATDLSTTAVEKAKETTQDARLDILWMQDDILNSRLDRQFGVIVDRGCFHVLPPQRRQDYVSVVASLLEPSGYLLLKCFSTLETRESGPYRFTASEIQAIFQSHFHLISTEETQYYGTLDPMPKALFCILGKEELAIIKPAIAIEP